jgi:hypothetical protein
LVPPGATALDKNFRQNGLASSQPRGGGFSVSIPALKIGLGGLRWSRRRLGVFHETAVFGHRGDPAVQAGDGLAGGREADQARS